MSHRRPTPSMRAFVGCMAIESGRGLHESLILAGYSVDLACPITIYKGRCYRRAVGVRALVRNGRLVRTRNDHELELWFRRLGSRLSGFAARRTEAA
jgi:hypothetical protein